MNKRVFIFSIFLLTILLSLTATNAQKRDNLTNEEDLLVRDAQQIDLRMKVFVKVVDRRLLALTDANAASSKQVQKDVADWGELRTGTGAEMFFDIQKTLSEAIAKIDDVAERDQKNPLFGKAIHVLADACKRYAPQFKTFYDKVSDDKEKVLIEQSVDNCNMIIEASSKVSKEVPKEEKKKDEKKKNGN